MDIKHTFNEALTKDNENELYAKCWEMGSPGDVFKIGDRLFELCEGLNWDSWIEVTG